MAPPILHQVDLDGIGSITDNMGRNKQAPFHIYAFMQIYVYRTERWLLWFQTSTVPVASNLFLQTHMYVPIVELSFKLNSSQAGCRQQNLPDRYLMS